MEIKKPEMFEMAAEGGKAKMWEQILMFIAIFLIGIVISTVPILIDFTVDAINVKNNVGTNEEFQIWFEETMASPSFTYISLYATIFSIIVVILFAKFKDKRSLRSIGFERKGAIKHYLAGVFIGFAMFGFVIAINLLTGAMTIESLINNLDGATLGLIAIFFGGFLIQGAEEEILVRGYLMVNLGAKHKVSTAIIISSIVFAALHLGNPGVTVLAMLNLTLFGVFCALYIICFNNIWGACAIHSIWNFVQGNFFGVSVSGMNTMPSIFAATNVPGKEFINGGAFGAEGGIATTIVLVLSIAMVLSYMKKKGQLQKKVIEKATAEKV